MNKLDFNTKNLLIKLSGTCFWYWGSFYSFLESCSLESNIYMQFGKEGGKYQVMRSILEFLERQERFDIISNIINQFYNFTLSACEDKINLEKADELLKEFRKVVGSSLIKEEITQREERERIKNQKKILEQKALFREKLSLIKKDFLHLQQSEDRQARGYGIEKLFFDLLELEEFESTRPYKNIGEQLDGHFKYEKFDYLVEIKWIEKGAKQSDLSIFDGKIKGKAQSTRGLFLSVNDFDQNAISKFSGDSPRIILMNGEDLFCVLNETISFFDLMKLKTDALARKGDIYTLYRNTI